ncbi:IscS subfamily cysteine desulfurase [Candidatus Blochmannia vicinus (nom. nud.)]|uniref:cysteine desulfurase n=1 Tax=Candidatus Blochmannia vicinus (nom. nud.) TaxID=251540 RepID=A0A9Q8TX06_9ENTR|nr:IscS subfamily cysteine desulfurase [Candidatus Blochmannia vicinus]URJ28245.1 IscS subfamily cysteine desulfurase [Candidatus Blochmannia vicinus]URJ30479.1 IscS subfamily cysteine desulfurase [Candidatus Blochmannia vicinus]
MKLPIYFDYAATTPVDPRVAEKMTQYLTLDGIFGNPSSRSHYYGWKAEEAVDIARKQIARLIGAESNEIIFTSGATESVNLAIKGIAQAYHKKGNHIITSMTEHKSVLDTCQYLENKGFKITRVIPQPNGLINFNQISNALRDETILLSIMHVNNEIGIIQDITKIGKLCRLNDIIFHVDATQSVGKLHIDLSVLPVDLMSFNGHKLYGPKGIGGLYVRRDRNPKINIITQMHGGGHEFGIRSGTLPVHQIIGMAEAYRLAKETMTTEMIYLKKMRNRLWKGLQQIEGVLINGDLNHSIGTLLNISFSHIDGETLMIALKDFALSSGSACASGTLNPSHVLQALGRNNELAYNSIRFSLGRFTTEEEIEYAIHHIVATVVKLNAMINVL